MNYNVYNASSDIIQICREYAEKENKLRLINDTYNKDIGTHRLYRRWTGKLGEFAAASKYGGQPNLELFETGSYRDEPDLMNYGWVKTCSIEEARRECQLTDDDPGFSWLISKKETIYLNPTSKDIVILSCSDYNTGRCFVFGHLLATELIGKYSEARKLNLRRHKKAILWKDIKGLIKPPQKGII